MNNGYWNDIVLYGIPICFVLGILVGGINAFKKAAQEAEIPAYDPMKYRS